MAHPNPHLAYRADIDGLRAIAVLAVVVFHAFPDALPGGFVGVDLFFVISGYLISSIIFKALAAGDFSFADFYSRRIRRIFPALVVVVLTALTVGWNVLFPDEYAQLGKHGLAGLSFVANLVLWQETGYFDTDAELKPFLHLWSLGVEEQFYILWPVLAVLAWRARLGVRRVILALLLASFVACLLATAYAPAAAYFLPLTRAWELLAGALLAWRGHRGRAAGATSAVRDRCAWAGIALIVLALFVVDEQKAFPGAWALLPVVGATLLIAAGPQAAFNRQVLARRALVGIGLISFPFYLWHWPLLAFLRIVQPSPSAGLRVAAVLAAIVLAWLTWRLIEAPVRRAQGRRMAFGLMASAVLVAGLGANVLEREGMPFRLKGSQAAQEAGALEWDERLNGTRDCGGVLPADFPGSCLIADAGRAPDAMLIGDSHANHYYYGLRDELRLLGVNLLGVTEAGCPLLYELDIYKDGMSLNCARVAVAALDHAISTPSVHTVFLGARWVAAVTGTQLKGRGDEAKGVKLVFGASEADLERGEAVALALDATLRRLTAAGKRVVVLEAVPELDFNARECIAWAPNAYVNRTPRPDCRVSRALIEARAAAYRPLLAPVFARYPAVSVLDPIGVMCDDSFCYGRHDGVLLYRDDDHLSLQGSHWLVRQLRPQLAELLEREAPSMTLANSVEAQQ